MPIGVITRPRRSPSDHLRDMNSLIDRGFRHWMDRSFGIDTEGWGVRQVGSTFWIHNSDRSIIPLGKTPEIALGHLKGLVHGLYLEDTLIEHGVLLPNWEELQ